MDLKEYKKKKESIIKGIEKTLKNVSDERLKVILNDKLDKLKNDKFVISVFGHFSNGKSTFLNALMEFKDEVLVENESASTATITKLKYAEDKNLKDKAEIIFNDNKKEIINAEELGYYTARNDEYDVEHKIKEVILYLDSELLSDGVEIVDTPGFNSTYSVHTEIAKAHVINSDASIFLFNYNKPGTAEEFSFLADVKDKMDRIFLVLNKIDLEDRTESTIEDTVLNLKNKIDKYGANVDSKIIYPISAKLEKEYLESHNEEKRVRGRFKEFKDSLISYLASEENVKDRLQAPLKSLIAEIVDLREEKKKQLEVLSLDENKFKEEIKKVEEEIEELSETLNDRKKELRKLLRNEVRKFSSKMERNKEVLEEELNDHIKDYKSNFSLNEDKFKSVLEDFEIKIKRQLRSSRESFIESLSQIVDMNIDSEDGFYTLKNKLKNAIEMEINISSNYDVEFLSSKNEYIQKIEDELKEREEKLEYLEKERNQLRKKSINVEKTSCEIEAAKKEIKDLKNQKRNRIMNIGDAPIKIVEKEEIRERKREGLFGAIGDVLFGKKREVVKIPTEDRSEHDYKNRSKKNVELEYGKEIEQKEFELRIKEEFISKDLDAEYRFNDVDNKYKKQSTDYSKKLIEFEEKRIENERNVLEINKRKFKRAIIDYIDENIDIAKKGIQENECVLMSILEEALSNITESIDKKKESLDDLRKAEITGDRDKSINEISNEILILNDSFKILEEAKEEIEKCN